MRTRIPDIVETQQVEDEAGAKARSRMKERNEKEKSRHDRTANEEMIEVGDKVLLKNKQKAKGQPKYDPEPYEVVQIHGRQTLLRRGDRKIWRETQKFKKIAPQTGDTSYHGGETDEWEESRDKRARQTPGR